MLVVTITADSSFYTQHKDYDFQIRSYHKLSIVPIIAGKKFILLFWYKILIFKFGTLILEHLYKWVVASVIMCPPEQENRTDTQRNSGTFLWLYSHNPKNTYEFLEKKLRIYFFLHLPLAKC